MRWNQSEVKKLSKSAEMKHAKIFSDVCVASAGNDVMGNESAVDHLGDGLRERERERWRQGWSE